MARAVLCTLALLALSACGAAIEPQDDQTLQAIVNETRAGRVDGVYERLTPDLRTPQSQAALGQLTTMLQNAGEPCERSMIGATTTRIASTSGSGRRITAQHKYVCPNGTLTIDLRLWVASDAPYVIENYHISPVDAAAAAQAAEFSLEGQSPRQYAFLAAAIGSLVLMLVALLGVIFTKGFKRKWIWAIVSFVGITKVSMIWSTGQVVTQFITINLIGWGIMRGGDPMAPWVVTFTPPVGALLVLSLLWPRWAGLRAGEELAGPQ